MGAWKFEITKLGVGGTVASEYALRSAGTLLSLVRSPPRAPQPDRGSQSLRSCLLWIGCIQTPNQPLYSYYAPRS
ncbi:hypothetical protein PoB_007018400 [Plakobranchus ocellatus]|uniref:Uncharacterized protein n=1 Tax=Plakobranchus ocellatus TaxID=259542 RepID=A0AAV4DI23_9GAST|nr:hypothetical protein PoB_007018400 [Plakobranchus ocellatus]